MQKCSRSYVPPNCLTAWCSLSKLRHRKFLICSSWILWTSWKRLFEFTNVKSYSSTTPWHSLIKTTTGPYCATTIFMNSASYFFPSINTPHGCKFLASMIAGYFFFWQVWFFAAHLYLLPSESPFTWMCNIALITLPPEHPALVLSQSIISWAEKTVLFWVKNE